MNEKYEQNELKKMKEDYRQEGLKGFQDESLLYYAHLNSYEFFAKIKLSLSQIFYIEDKTGKNLIHYIAQAGNTELLTILTPYISNIDSLDRDDSTPLYIAVLTQNIEMVSLLLSMGSNCKGKSAFTEINDNEDIHDLLMAYGAAQPLTEIMANSTNFQLFLSGVKVPNVFKLQDRVMETPTIAHNVFYLWLTNPNKATEPSKEHLDYVKRSMENFKNSTTFSDWDFRFYTNAPDSLPFTADFFNKQGFRVIDINPLLAQFKTADIIEASIVHKKYGIAADLVRYELVSLDGGIYLDLNFALDRALDNEIVRYSYINFNGICSNQEVELEFGAENYFFAARSEHPVLIESLQQIRSLFYGENAKLMWNALNNTDRVITDLFYNIFSEASMYNGTSANDPGVIYNFYRPNCTGIYSEHNNKRCLLSEAVFSDVIDELQCVNENIILPIGVDGHDGDSWV